MVYRDPASAPSTEVVHYRPVNLAFAIVFMFFGVLFAVLSLIAAGSWADKLFGVVFSLFWLVASSRLLVSARLEFDLARGIVHYTRTRFPLRSAHRTLRAANVRGVRVARRRGAKGANYFSVVLDMGHGGELDLVPGAGCGRRRAAEVVSKISALLARMRDD